MELCFPASTRSASRRKPGRHVAGPVATRRPWGECPPASACGGSLLLYFAPGACGSRRDCRISTHRKAGAKGEIADSTTQHPRLPQRYCRLRQRLPFLRTTGHVGTTGADAPGSEIEEEAAAAGRRRGTFTSRGIRARRASQIPEPALFPGLLPIVRQKKAPACGRGFCAAERTGLTRSPVRLRARAAFAAPARPQPAEAKNGRSCLNRTSGRAFPECPRNVARSHGNAIDCHDYGGFAEAVELHSTTSPRGVSDNTRFVPVACAGDLEDEAIG